MEKSSGKKQSKTRRKVIGANVPNTRRSVTFNNKHSATYGRYVVERTVHTILNNLLSLVTPTDGYESLRNGLADHLKQDAKLELYGRDDFKFRPYYSGLCFSYRPRLNLPKK